MLYFAVFVGHQTRSSLPELSRFLPPSGSSLFFSCDCTLFFTMANRQTLWNHLLSHCFRRDGGCAPSRPVGPSDRQRSNVFRTYPFSFHTLAHSLARSKTQLFSFHAIPHSLPENTGGGVSQGSNLPTLSPAATLFHPWHANDSANTFLPISIGANAFVGSV